MILPMIDVPVSLVGTFAVMAVMGFSLNNLTLFGMVLAIGIVVDDAIVVLENVERQMSFGLDARNATIKAMSEITGPDRRHHPGALLGVSALRVHAGSVSGQFFRQFALTIAAAMVISAINAMTLTPSRAVAIFQRENVDEHGHPRREALPWWIFVVLGGLLSLWIAKRVFAAELGLEAGTNHGDGLSWPLFFALTIPGAILGGIVGRFVIGPIKRRAFATVWRLQSNLRLAYEPLRARHRQTGSLQHAGLAGLRRTVGCNRLELQHGSQGISSPFRTRATCSSTFNYPTPLRLQRTQRVMEQVQPDCHRRPLGRRQRIGRTGRRALPVRGWAVVPVECQRIELRIQFSHPR